MFQGRRLKKVSSPEIAAGGQEAAPSWRRPGQVPPTRTQPRALLHAGCACNTRWQARSQAPSPPHVPRPRPMTGSPEERGEGSDRSEAFWNRRTIVDYGGRKLLRPVEIKDEWCRGGGQPAGRPAVGPAVRARACARTARQLALAPHAVHASHAKDRHRLRRSQTAAAGLRVLVRTQTSPPCGPPRTSAAAPAASAR